MLEKPIPREGARLYPWHHPLLLPAIMVSEEQCQSQISSLMVCVAFYDISCIQSYISYLMDTVVLNCKFFMKYYVWSWHCIEVLKKMVREMREYQYSNRRENLFQTTLNVFS